MAVGRSKKAKARRSKRLRVVPRSVLFAGLAGVAVVPILAAGCDNRNRNDVLGVAATCADYPTSQSCNPPDAGNTTDSGRATAEASVSDASDAEADAPRDGSEDAADGEDEDGG